VVEKNVVLQILKKEKSKIFRWLIFFRDHWDLLNVTEWKSGSSDKLNTNPVTKPLVTITFIISRSSFFCLFSAFLLIYGNKFSGVWSTISEVYLSWCIPYPVPDYNVLNSLSHPKRLFPDPTSKGIPDPDPTWQVFFEIM